MRLITLNIVMILMLSGCVHATYEADTANGEYFELWSLFKSVDGLETKKGPFELKIDKTHSQNPTADLVELMRLVKELE